VRRHLSYFSQLIDLRMTLTQRRRLLIAGGWLSLLAATVDIDLRRRPAAEIRLATGRDGGPRPRRIAAARLDLALALLATDRPDEAADQAITAITSRRIVPSNFGAQRRS